MFTEITCTSKGVMLEKFQSLVDKNFPFLKSGKLYLAISGGKDSMALSSLLLESGINHSLLHCNFQLRGKESDDDEQFLRDFACRHKLEIYVQKFNTAEISEREKLTIQECARKLRYDWFRTFLDKNDDAFLLTAHHLDDSIETFFINLFRGTGFRGLSGIPVYANQIVRPLSDFTAEEIYRYIDLKHLDYRSDSSNAKKDYLRNKVRHDLIPVLGEMEPQFRTKMNALFDEFTSLKSYLDEGVKAFNDAHQRIEKETVVYPLDNLISCHPFLREQVFRTYGIHRKNGGEFVKFLNSTSGSEFRAADYLFRIDRDTLVIKLVSDKSSDVFFTIDEVVRPVYLTECGLRIEKKENVEIIKDDSSIQQLDFSKIEFPITIRNWKNGDFIKPLGMSGTKLVSDILTDKKIKLSDKESLLVIVNGNGQLMALAGIMIADDFKISGNSNKILEIAQVI